MALVLDAHALVAYFEKEPGYEKVQAFLTEADQKRKPLLLSVINWGEIFYVVHRKHSREAAERIAKVIDNFAVEIVPIDLSLAKQAAFYKATHKMSYADAFAASLAKLKKAALITGDKDFKPFQSEIKIEWL